jgi:putative hydrolase of the HAD superfamily
MFEAVAFDLGGTLIDYVGVPASWQQGYPQALAAVCASLGVSPSCRALAWADELLIAHNSRLAPREREVRDSDLFGELFARLGAGPGLSSPAFDAAVDCFFGVFRGQVRAVAGGAGAVDALRSLGVAVGALTDVAYAMPRRLALDDLRLTGLSALAPFTLTSVDVGWRKPRPEGYRQLASALGVPVDGMLYIGNEAKDVQGARAAGAGAALLWRESGPAPSWGQTYTIGSLGDVPMLVR